MNMQLIDYVLAGYPAVIYTTAEEDRALKECQDIANRYKFQFATWSLTKGFEKGKEHAEVKLPMEVLNKGLSLVPDGKETSLDGGIYCIFDFHPYIKNPDVWRTAKDVFKAAKPKGITYVFISTKFELPPELEREVIVTSMQLPTREQIQLLLEEMVREHECQTPSDEEKNNAVEAAMGLTLKEAENAFAVSLAKEEKLSAKLISQVKEQIICNEGLLEFKSSDETLESIGGLKSFTNWAMDRLSAYSPEAQKYGLPYPKGVMLIGVPGCGKSLTAKALANMWQKPLLKLDVGKLFGSLVGDTEAKTRRALDMAEAMAPAILWIDEIEKGLSGIQSSGRTDSGVTSRMFGTILTWLQEKKAPVFVIATANNITELPPEFLRKGRFDEIFFVDLPTIEERKAIFAVQLKKYKRKVEEFNIEELANSTEDYTGAEIEECVVSAMYSAWNDKKREVTTEDILKSIQTIKPMASGMMKHQVEKLREYAKESSIRSANSASSDESTLGEAKSSRRVRTKKGA